MNSYEKYRQLYVFKMPTVLLVNGFRFFFYASDRLEPIHVHISKGSGIGKVWLEPKVKVQYFVDYKKQEQKEIIELIIENEALLKEKWNEFFSK